MIASLLAQTADSSDPILRWLLIVAIILVIVCAIVYLFVRRG